MQTMTLSQSSYESLKDLTIPFINNEGRLFVINDQVLFKRFYIDKGEYFGNKLLTLNALFDNNKVLSNRCLILPEKIVLVDKKVVGFTMPYIKDNINLSVYLDSIGVSLEDKIFYLQRVAKILEDVQSIAELKNNFFLGDVHSSNFIIGLVNSKLQDLYAVDLDSVKIGENLPFLSKYLSTNPNLRKNSKYKIGKNGLIEPDANTEWLCYIIMILNFIGNFNINSLKVEKFYTYLSYLKDIGFNQELIDCFAKIYSPNEPNLNPSELLDSIPDDYFKADFKEFIKRL